MTLGARLHRLCRGQRASQAGKSAECSSSDVGNGTVDDPDVVQHVSAPSASGVACKTIQSGVFKDFSSIGREALCRTVVVKWEFTQEDKTCLSILYIITLTCGIVMTFEK